MIIDFIIEDLMLNSYLQKNFHTLSDICLIISDEGVVLVLFGKLFNVTPFSVYKIKIQ